MTMKTSCNSPPQWSKGEQHFSTPAATKAFAWLVSSETACAIWFVLDPKWVSVTRVLRFGVVRYVFQQRLEVTGKYMQRLEMVSMLWRMSHRVIDSKPRRVDLRGEPSGRRWRFVERRDA